MKLRVCSVFSFCKELNEESKPDESNFSNEHTSALVESTALVVTQQHATSDCFDLLCS